MKPYDGDFDALTGAIFASWFSLGPKGPAAYAVGFAETTDRPWSLFYRCMRPTGAATYLGAAVDQEIAAADDFFEAFFNLLLGLNNYYIVNSGDVPGFPFLASIIAIFSGAQLLSLGLIGEYLARMHTKIMDRPTYAIRDEITEPLALHEAPDLEDARGHSP